MATPAIIATGSAVPAGIRTNDDPIFDWLKANPPPGPPLFAGYDERRVLAPTETLVGLMAEAASNALTAAGVDPGDVDLVVGYASFGSWSMPNDLVVLAAKLGVPPTALIVPINSEYANFPHALLTAEGLLTTGRATTALIAVGADWTRFVSYHTEPAVSAGDGAGAAVMALSDDATRWRILDVAVAAEREFLGGMYVAGDPSIPPVDPPTWGAPYFHLEPLGFQGFKEFGVPVPPQLVKEVLARNGLTPADIAFVGHQTSIYLNQPWQAALQPGAFVETLATLANMTSASIPVNLDRCAGEITQDHVALVALGPETSCTVVLLGRTASSQAGDTT
jgi:3-oxoacyl-[acyl-carrier-protein] synthase-3